MAQDLCPGFMDYLGMGHLYHKIRVPGRGEKWGVLGEELGLPSPGLLRVCGGPSVSWPGLGVLVPLHVGVTKAQGGKGLA